MPSTNELAAFYRINPATAAKGINMLADDGLLEKRRGIGMFVAAGARERLLGARRKQFAEQYVEPLVTEASRLGIDADELIALIRESHERSVQGGEHDHDAGDLGRRPDPPLPWPRRPDDVPSTSRPASITGLLGRNGAGKTTLMRIIAGQEFATAGSVRVLGASPVENDAILRRMVFVREDQVYPDLKVRHALQAASWFYPNWDAELAEMLMADFGLPAEPGAQEAVPRDALGGRASSSGWPPGPR